MAIFRRHLLASDLADRLLCPSVLDEGLRSGLFLSGLRRIGKTTFLVHDLIPALQARGAIVIYVDLWSDTKTSPAALVHAAIRKTLTDLQSPGSKVVEALRQVSGGEVGAFGFSFSFETDRVGAEAGPTLAAALEEVVDQARRDVVLIVDEVQHAMTSDEGDRLLMALKAARDRINPRPNTAGHFLFIGTGSHRSMVNELTARRSQAFNGATSAPYPELGMDYVEHLLDRLAAEGARVPSSAIAVEGFRMIGSRPEEMVRALRLLQRVPPEADADAHFLTIARTLRGTAAEVEIARLEQLGALAIAIFDRVASSGEDGARRLYATDAVESYAVALGRDVRIEEVQPVINELVSANILMRRGHGIYGVTDPFVQEVWCERKALTEL